MTDSDKPYTNREIREKWHDIGDTMQRIETQTTLTNGRVTALEQWKYVGMGATGMITLVIFPILGWALYTLVNIDKTINHAVDGALAAYDITNIK